MKRFLIATGETLLGLVALLVIALIWAFTCALEALFSPFDSQP